MDKRIPASEQAEEVTPGQGADTPTGVPHRCPYAALGADKDFCLNLTANYNRNLSGCCGTNDSRNFGPCNFKWRKCFKCLAEGKGKNAGEVVDVARGLCQDHVDVSFRQKPTTINEPIRPLRVTRFNPPAFVSIPAERPKAQTFKVRQFVPAPKKPPEPKPVTYSKPPAIPTIKFSSTAAKPKPVQARSIITDVPESVIDECARRIPLLTSRFREIVRAALAGKRKLEGLTEGSFVVKFGDACNRIGLPKYGQGKGGVSRRTVLVKVMARYEQLVSENKIPESIRSAVEVNKELRSLLKDKTLEEKELIIEYARSLKADG